MVGPEPVSPLRKQPHHLLAHTLPALKLDAVALPVIETDGLDPGVGAQRVAQTHGRVLPA